MTPAEALAQLASGCGIEGRPHATVMHRLRHSLLADSWLVEWAGERAVLRIDQPAAAAMGLDRAEEFARLQAVAAAGLGPAPIAADPGRGLLLRRHVEGSVWKCANLRQAAKLERVAALLREVHSAQIAAPPVDLGAAVDRYAGLAGAGSAGLASTTRGLLASCRDPQAPLVFCHNDPVSGNFVAGPEPAPGSSSSSSLGPSSGPDSSSDPGPGPGSAQKPTPQLWLIDWEYSGFNEFWFDLAVVIGHHELSTPLAQAFLKAYLGCLPSAAEQQRLAGWVAFYVSLSRLWSAALITPSS